MTQLTNLSVNFSGSARHETIDGREYVVVPLTMIVPGVLQGSKGRLYYPDTELARNVDSWNGMPIVIDHPRDADGMPTSARSPNVKNIGTVFNARFNGKLVAEGWFDVDRTQRASPKLYSSLLSGKPVELSTGLFTDNEPVSNKPYEAIARNYRPDHLAVLIDKRGACCVEDGCGVNVNEVNLMSLNSFLESELQGYCDPNEDMQMRPDFHEGYLYNLNGKVVTEEEGYRMLWNQ